jgi:hypothetical protein
MNSIEMAKSTTLDYSVGDLTSRIAHSNALKGYSRILSCLHDKNILGDNSKLIALPDYTFTKNRDRWTAGFANGYILHIDSKRPFIPVGFRANCCGIIMSKLKTPFKRGIDSVKEFAIYYKEQLNKVEELAQDDVSRKNHFLGIYYNSADDSYYALLHCSFNFVKTGYDYFNKKYVGISIDECSYWNDKIISENFENESLQYLIDDDAVEYYNCYKHMEEFSKTTREKIMKKIFPQSETIFNEVHQGFLDENTILLGAYASVNELIDCPIMLAPKEKLPIVNVTGTVTLGNKKIYCAPHGCGYTLWGFDEGSDYINIESDISVISDDNGFYMPITNPLDLPYGYRTAAASAWCDKHKMATTNKQLETLSNFRI